MNSSGNELRDYLANVVAVALTDGSISPKEAAAIERIRADIKATKSDLNKATKLVEGGVHKVKKLGRFSAQISNLEAMIYVALVDGVLSEGESNIVGELAADIGLDQKQLDQITAETSAEIANDTIQVKCRSCAALISGGAKFCPSCGSPIPNSDAVEDQSSSYTIPQTGFAIEFGESNALNFQAALDHAKTSATFGSALKGNKCWYVAGWPKEAFDGVYKLANLLSGLRNRRLFLDGAEQPWDDVFQFSWCARQREQAYRPTEYCFGLDEKRLNPFGCKQLRMEWSGWSDWFSLGAFRNSGRKSGKPIWVFDKDKIRHQVNTNLFKFRFCPHLRAGLTESIIEALPDEVDPAADSDWEYKDSYDAVPGSVKIVENQGGEGFSMRVERDVFGVRPRGLNALRDILTLAFQNAGIEDLSVDDLVK
jgi:hypothetical protein